MDEKPDIGAVLEHYGTDMSRVHEGRWCTIKCPFHEDHHASGRVNITLGQFTCNACPARGDSWKLIMDAEEIGFRDAVKFAGSNLGYEGREVSRPPEPRYIPSWCAEDN